MKIKSLRGLRKEIIKNNLTDEEISIICNEKGWAMCEDACDENGCYCEGRNVNSDGSIDIAVDTERQEMLSVKDGSYYISPVKIMGAE